MLRATPVEHPVEAYALRLDHDGASLVYSGDTGPCRGPGRAGAGRGRAAVRGVMAARRPRAVDEPPAGLHMSGRQAGEHATAAGVGRLLLTHVPVWCDPAALLAEAREAFDGPVELVAAGRRHYDV